ncbi:ribonuclease H-like domain-containing protein [Lipomyces arxii]|uniref:ribonuclease H-like domain-containing protein n=1 Tax=Lipomyces arxii TaxID=56418 RepID=UPI0034CE42A8
MDTLIQSSAPSSNYLFAGSSLGGYSDSSGYSGYSGSGGGYSSRSTSSGSIATSPASPTVVYTDGSALGNGRNGARGGVGVYFGENDSRNVSRSLDGDVQTNQRAELSAIRDALKITRNDDHVTVKTDSMYAKNSVTDWSKNWQDNGWKNARGEPVANQDIIKDVLTEIGHRERSGKSTTFEHVAAHNGEPGNEAADRLANQGAGRR